MLELNLDDAHPSALVEVRAFITDALLRRLAVDLRDALGEELAHRKIGHESVATVQFSAGPLVNLGDMNVYEHAAARFSSEAGDMALSVDFGDDDASLDRFNLLCEAISQLVAPTDGDRLILSMDSASVSVETGHRHRLSGSLTDWAASSRS
ncbi:hypothetical protein ASD66_19150 [Nocardioides sp. Root151]|nr:hypothetical protein ASD66_19150 [Nocardioides sp. Root151]